MCEEIYLIGCGREVMRSRRVTTKLWIGSIVGVSATETCIRRWIARKNSPILIEGAPDEGAGDSAAEEM